MNFPFFEGAARAMVNPSEGVIALREWEEENTLPDQYCTSIANISDTEAA
jgi:hypothetical protein